MHAVLRRASRLGLPYVWLLAIATGALVGVASVAFRIAIDAFQTLAYGADDADIVQHLSDAPWWLFFAVPTGVGLLVGLLIQFGLPGGRAHGIADVIRARDIDRGRVNVREGLVTALVATLSLGGGASTGREGPVVHIGATISSAVSGALHLGASQSRTLLGCAAAAAVSALFNAPLAGTLFALEVVLGAYSIRVFAPIVVASACGALVNRALIGDTPGFTVPSHEMATLWQLPLFLFLGVIAAVAAIALSSMIFAVNGAGDRLQARLRLPLFLRPAIAGLLLGAIGLHWPEVVGVGYAATSGALSGAYPFALACAVIAAKMLAVAISFGGRFGGGLFSPSLMLGALVGAAYGDLLLAYFAWIPLPPVSLFALAGMGALSAVMLGAPISTTLIVFELTGDYRTALAVMTAVSVATVLAQRRIRRSFFYEQLEREGVPLAGGRHRYALRCTPIARILDEPWGAEEERRARGLLAEGLALRPGDSLAEMLAQTKRHGIDFVPVADDGGNFVGVAHRSDALAFHSRMLREEYDDQHD